MLKATWIALLMVSLAFAGCQDEPEILLNSEYCESLGLILKQVELYDNDTGETYFEPQCVDNVPSVTVELGPLPAEAFAYSPVELTWIMHTTLDHDHSHNNGIRISKVSDPEYVGKIDGYGVGILGGKEEHRDMVDGDSSTVQWKPTDTGTYYIRAYAVSSWGNYWAPEVSIEVGPIKASGITHLINVSGGGAPGVSSIDPASLDIILGDAIQWQSSDPGVTWTIQRTRGPADAERFNTTANGDAVVFTVPGAYTYDATSDAPESVPVEGSFNVVRPEEQQNT